MKNATKSSSRPGGFGHEPSAKSTAKDRVPNNDLFTFCKIPTPLQALYVSNGEIVACLDANGEPWNLKQGRDSGNFYWNKVTLGGRRRKTKEEQDKSDEDQINQDGKAFKEDDIPY